MRVIKFRAWDGETMFYQGGSPELTFAFGTESTVNAWSQGGEWLFEVASPIIMQFTGLTDKNGKEIYEGDIMDYGHNRFKPIVFKDGCFQMEGIALTSLIPLYHVIGNIYEHPELLTNQK